jgi:hypothetical protein
MHYQFSSAKTLLVFFERFGREQGEGWISARSGSLPSVARR